MKSPLRLFDSYLIQAAAMLSISGSIEQEPELHK